MAADKDLVDLCIRQLELCGVREGENIAVLSVADVRRDYADAFLAAGSRLGAHTFEVHLAGGDSATSGAGVWAVGLNPLTGNELAIETLKQADLVIDLVFLLHSKEQVEIQAAGTRMLLVMEPPETLARLFPTADQRRRVETSEELLATAKTLRVTSPGGTDATYRLGAYPVMTQYGYTDTSGRWDHWPSTFLFTNGHDDGVEGKVVVDRGDIVVAPFLRYVESPIEFTIEQGRIVDLRGGLDADLLKDYIAEWDDPRGLAVSHIGWGLNEKARASRVAAASASYGMEARSLYGNVMFSTGPNQELGGTNSTPCHIDIPMRGCSVLLDDEPLLVEGEFAIEELRARPIPASTHESHAFGGAAMPAKVGEVPTVEGFDPLTQEYNRNPDPVLVRARRECPVFYHPPLDVWVVTRYEDILEATKDYKTFSSRAFRSVPPPPELVGRVPSNLLATAFPNLDPPEHTVSRKTANKWFTLKQVAAQESVINELAHELIDGFIADGRCDLMQEYCYPLSLGVILRMLGLPLEDSPRFRQWTEDMFSLMSPGPADADIALSRPMPEAERQKRYGRIAEAWEYYGRVIEERRQHPREDMTSAMVHAQDESGRPALSTDTIIFHMIELTAAGNDTTANLMGNVVQFFDANPDQLEELKRDPSLLENAVEEGLRRRPTSPQMYRITTRDVELGGVTIPARSIVCLSFGSGSNDEAHFPDPLSFDIHRENADEHLAFGHGRHFCLGAPLARLEARLGLEALYERIPNIRVVPGQTLEFIPVVTVQTLISLQVAWT